MKKSPREKKTRAMELCAKIDALAILRALEEHVLGIGKKRMTASQVSAALALLKNLGTFRSGEHDDASAAAAHEDSLKDLE